LIGLLLSKFAQYADVKPRLSEQPFMECIKKIKAAMEGASEESRE
jgi:hypothetical protein